MNADRITPEVARERIKASAETARHAIHRARMLHEHGHGPEAREAEADARGHVALARFYRERATGESLARAATTTARGRGEQE